MVSAPFRAEGWVGPGHRQLEGLPLCPALFACLSGLWVWTTQQQLLTGEMEVSQSCHGGPG